METHSPSLILANLCNEIDFASTTPETSRGDVPLEGRELAFTRPGDVIVTSRPIGDDFQRYLLETLEVDPASILNLDVSAALGETLTASIRRNRLIDDLRQLVKVREITVLAPYALDYPTLDLASELGVGIFGYDRGFPDQGTMDAVRELSSKGGFRATAQRLGLPIVHGGPCIGFEHLLDMVRDVARPAPGVIVKFNRASSGYGNLILDRDACASPDLRKSLRQHLDAHPGQPDEFVVEEFAQFERTPSVQMFVGESGPFVDFLCDMRCCRAAFQGVVFPCLDLPGDADGLLRDHAERFGEHLRVLGFRGYCDLDAGVLADGGVFFTETNLRRTGATYARTLVRRLRGTLPVPFAWLTDARKSRRPSGSLDFRSAVSSLRDAGLAFDRRSRTGVVLTADSVSSDGKWRYLVIGSDIEHARGIEDSLTRLFCSV